MSLIKLGRKKRAVSRSNALDQQLKSTSSFPHAAKSCVCPDSTSNACDRDLGGWTQDSRLCKDSDVILAKLAKDCSFVNSYTCLINAHKSDATSTVTKM